jgi:hypothetical protein
MAGIFDGIFGSLINAGAQPENVSTNGTTTSRKVLSKEAFDKIVYDVLSSDQGLASLAGGENSSGGYGSSTKSQLAQDLVTKLSGELASITAPTVSTTSSETDTDSVFESIGSKMEKFGKVGSSLKSGLSGGIQIPGKVIKGKTVICTELNRQGLLPTELYEAGTPHFLSLPGRTIIGYHCWAKKVVPLMQKSRRLSESLLPIALARYNHITGRKRNALGFLTVWVAQPICYIVGYIIEVLYGFRFIEHA